MSGRIDCGRCGQAQGRSLRAARAVDQDQESELFAGGRLGRVVQSSRQNAEKSALVGPTERNCGGFVALDLWGASEVLMVEREHEERRRLMSEAFHRGAARLARERERQRTAEVEKSLRLRELHLANEAAEASQGGPACFGPAQYERKAPPVRAGLSGEPKSSSSDRIRSRHQAAAS